MTDTMRSERHARKPSPANWRFEPQLHIAEHNKSAEKILEKAIARVLPGWVNQVPTASGLASSRRDRHRNIDLVHRIDPRPGKLLNLTNSAQKRAQATVSIKTSS